MVSHTYHFFIFEMMLEAEIKDTKDKLSDLTEETVDLVGGKLGDSQSPVSPIKDPAYSDTKEQAEKIEGSSLMHEMYNAIVDLVERKRKETGIVGYNVEYVLGTNFTESNGVAGAKWIPWNSAPAQAINQPGFSLKKWSYKDAVEWKQKTGFDIKSSRAYIGAFQTEYKWYGTGMSKPSASWGLTQWGQFVQRGNKKYDNSGDGLLDPHNWYDAIYMNYVFANSKYTETAKNWKLSTTTHEEDMRTLAIASHYVGVQNWINGSAGAFGSSKPEAQHPYILLMRSAVNEYYSNGPYYQKFKKAMEDLPTTTTHFDASKNIIEDFYKANGWKRHGSIGYAKDGFKVKGYTADQDVHYAIRVYWGGKVARENMEKIMAKTE